MKDGPHVEDDENTYTHDVRKFTNSSIMHLKFYNTIVSSFVSCLFQESNYDTNLSEDQVKTIASQQVHQTDQSCEELMEILIKDSEQFLEQAEVFYITKESAKEYKQSMEGKPDSLTIHIRNCVVNNKTIFSRVDHRVSKEILTCKLCFNATRHEFVIDSQKSSSSLEKHRIRFPFTNTMGMEISKDTLKMDISKAPIFESKLKTSSGSKSAFSSKWDMNTTYFDPCDKYTVTLVTLQDTGSKLLEIISKDSALRCAMRTGINNHYPEFVPFADEHPHERMPILKDPVLVRAAQLAILNIEEKSRDEDLELVVKRYQGIERSFRRLLKDRLRPTRSTPSHEQ